MSSKKSILHCLETIAGQEEKLIAAIDLLAAEKGRAVYQNLFQILTSLELAPEKAEATWQEVVSLRNTMQSAMGRPVSLRTAICDFFCSVDKSLQNPKLIEINQFDKVVAYSQHDDLTGLYNRRIFNELLSHEISRAERYGNDLSILFYDIDDFKKVNDTYSHPAGDEVLKAVSTVFMEKKRNEDIVARYGGEEIILLLPETGKTNALILGERIRKAVEKLEVKFENRSIRVTISAGLASFPYDASGAVSLLKDADTALFLAKAIGKNMIRLFSPDKRRYFRVDFRKKIKLGELGFNGSGEHTATSKNISGRGLLVESSKKHAVGARLQAMISLQRKTPLLLTGSVVRVKQRAEKRYDTGISFFDVDNTARREILCYMLHRLERQSKP